MVNLRHFIKFGADLSNRGRDMDVFIAETPARRSVSFEMLVNYAYTDRVSV